LRRPVFSLKVRTESADRRSKGWSEISQPQPDRGPRGPRAPWFF
jgi:hypothetical protein